MIEIRGHADAVGNEARNENLSQRRAKAVEEFLVACGFPRSTFQTLGLGAPPPTVASPLPEQSDRRVGFKIVLKEKDATP